MSESGVNPYIADDIRLPHLFEEFEELEAWMACAQQGWNASSKGALKVSVPRSLFEIKNRQMKDILQAMYKATAGLCLTAPEVEFVMRCAYVLGTFQLDEEGIPTERPKRVIANRENPSLTVVEGGQND